MVAICRGDLTTVLPTGHEQLRADEVLAVSGSPAALERARGILKGIELAAEAH